MKIEIIIEAKRLEEDCKHTSKSHFICAEFWRYLHYSLGIPATIFAGLASANSIFQKTNSYQITILFSVLATIFIPVLTFLNPQEKANQSLNAGNDFNSIRKKLRRFYSIDINDESIGLEKFNRRLEQLSNKQDDLNKKSPPIFNWAYRRGKKAIDAGETDYRIDENKSA